MFDACPDHDTPLMQDPAFAAALRHLGQTPLTLPDGRMLLSQRLLGMRVLMLPRAAPPFDLMDQLRDIGLHRQPLILSPDAPCKIPHALRLRAPQQRALLDLSPCPDTRRRALHAKWRNALKRAEKSNLRIKQAPLPADPNHPVLTGETIQSGTRGYANWPAPLTAAFAKVAPTQTHLFTAHLENKPVAHMLFLRHGSHASYHIGHTTDLGKRHAAHTLLLWHAANWFAKRTCRSLDLGLVHPDAPGLTRFKIRAGAVLKPTGGTWLHWNPLARTRAA